MANGEQVKRATNRNSRSALRHLDDEFSVIAIEDAVHMCIGALLFGVGFTRLLSQLGWLFQNWGQPCQTANFSIVLCGQRKVTN